MKRQEITGGDLRTRYGRWADYRFRAFISYSHADTEWAEKIEARLTRFVMPLELTAIWTPFGPPPRRMKPVFRDRSQARAHHDIDNVLTDALDDSAALIVVCSPSAARSSGVNFEIEHFIAKGRRDRIFPIIVDGEPGDGDRDPFPPSLRKSLEAEQLTHGGATPLAADARPGKDGWPGALLKVIAGMAGVDLGLITRDDQRRERYEQYRAYFSAMILSGLLITSLTLGFAWDQRSDALRTQSRYLARASQQQTDNGAAHEGLLLALEALPPAGSGIFDRPVTTEALEALNASLEKLSLQSRKLSKTCAAAARVFHPDKALVALQLKDTDTDRDTLPNWQIPVAGDVLAVSDRQYVISTGDNIEIRSDADDKDGIIRIIDIKTEANQSDSYTAAAFAKGGVMIATASGKVDFWQIEEENTLKLECLKPESTGSSKFRRIAASPDGSLFAGIEFENRPMTLWTFDGRKCQKLGSRLDDPNIAFAEFISNDRLATISVSDDKQLNSVDTWSLTKSGDGEFVDVLLDPNSQTVRGAVRSLAASHQGLIGIALAAKNEIIDDKQRTERNISDAANTSESSKICRLQNPDNWQVLVFSLGPTGSGAQLVRTLAGFESDVLDLMVERREELAEISVVTRTGFSKFEFMMPNEFSIGQASAQSEKDDEFQGLLISLLGHTAAAASAEFSSDGKWVVSASTDRTARIWDRQTGRVSKVLVGHTAPVTDARYSPDGKVIATTSDDRTVRIWDASTGDAIAVLRGHEGYLNAVSFHPDGTKIATASDDNIASLWDTRSGILIRKIQHSDKVNSVTFSPDGKEVATSGEDGVLRLWEVVSKDNPRIEIVPPFENMSGCVWINDATFSRDGHVVAVGYGLNRSRPECKSNTDFARIQVFDVKTGSKLGGAFGPTENVLSVAFSPNVDDLLAASTISGTMTLWRVSSNGDSSFIAEFAGQDFGKANSVAFSTQKNEIVVAYQDGSARLWSYRTPEKRSDSQTETDSDPSNATDAVVLRILKQSYLHTMRKKLITDGCRRLQEIPLHKASDNSIADNFLDADAPPPCERVGMLSGEWWRRRFAKEDAATAPQ